MIRNGFSVCFLNISFFLLLFSCSTQSTEKTKPDGFKNEKTGKELYQQFCVNCHGYKGNLGFSGAFDLTKSTLSFEESIIVITKGRKLMAGFELLISKKDIEKIASYCEELSLSD